MDDLTRRAFAAYFRSADREGVVAVDQPAIDSGPVEYQGRTYVVLRNVRGTLAVYRVRTTGLLRRLKRWPKAIETMPPEPRERPSESRSGPAERKE
jgi:hypothetical protein